MNNKTALSFLVATAAMAQLLGCASVNPRADYDRVDRQVEHTIGRALTYRPGDEPDSRAAAERLLEDGLTADEAVQVALLNNPRVRAALAQVGILRAEVIQAGLLSNPTLGLAFKLPEGGGLTQFEMGLAQNIADLWMIPARLRAARRDSDRAILETAREVALLAYDTRVAYFNAVAAQRQLDIASENLELVGQLESVTRARLEAGTIGSLDVNLVRGLVLRVQVTQRNARLAVSSAKRALATLLGLDGPAENLALVDKLPNPLAAPLDVERLVEVARAERLDLRAAHEAVLAAEARVEAEYARVFRDVQIGLQVETGSRRAPPGRKVLADTARASVANGSLAAPGIESRGQRRLARSQIIEAMVGPSLGVTLPIFDQNQAQIARAKFEMDAADAFLESVDRAVAQETREAADRLQTAWAVARLYEQEVLPQASTTLQLSKSAYQAGNTPILNVIDAQRSLLETRLGYIAALQSASNAVVDLERATARPADVLFGESLETQPAASQPQSSGPSLE